MFIGSPSGADPTLQGKQKSEIVWEHNLMKHVGRVHTTQSVAETPRTVLTVMSNNALAATTTSVAVIDSEELSSRMLQSITNPNSGQCRWEGKAKSGATHLRCTFLATPPPPQLATCQPPLMRTVANMQH
ncbi:hypothetical protein J6590_043974 [Homalodisca vitripennis]|nr:hypothetical protein J6590_043974 [Homalodisca vitripennis]